MNEKVARNGSWSGIIRHYYPSAVGRVQITVQIFIIIQQIVTLSKYGHDALDICHP